MNNILVFLDTMVRIKRDKELCGRTLEAKKGSRIYKEGFRSDKNITVFDCEIKVEEAATLDSAEQYKEYRTAVLNFANGFFPGGGVLLGTNAQEEYLCRQSNLYSCIAGIRTMKFYLYNIWQCIRHPHFLAFEASDRLIYSKDVTVLKRDNQICKPYTVDVITCAAPCFYRKQKERKYPKIKELFTSRIANILESALDNGVEMLILGAFGCGDFNNPPEIVALAFRELLESPRYRGAFRKAVFAIKGGGNLEVFERVLFKEGEKERGKQCG